MSVLRDNHDKIGRMLAEGIKRKEIARAIGVHHSSVGDYVCRHFSGSAPKAVGSQGVDGEVSREEMLAAELRELRQSSAKGRRSEVLAERMRLAIVEGIERVAPPEVRLPEYLDYAAALDQQSPEAAHHRQLVLLSDWHGGEYVSKSQVNGLNSYDWEIMEARVDEVVASLLVYKRRAPELTGLDIGFLGDMTSGTGHEEIARSNVATAAEQAIRIGYLMGQTVERLVPHYPELRVFGLPGNHGRLVKAPAAKNVGDNLDTIGYEVAKLYLKGYDSVSFVIAESNIHFHEIAGLRGCFFHGDGIKSSMVGVPQGGLIRRASTLHGQYPFKIDFFALGHFHEATWYRDRGIFINGALKGADEWCLKHFGSGQKPSQTLLTFDEKRSRFVGAQSIDPTAGL